MRRLRLCALKNSKTYSERCGVDINLPIFYNITIPILLKQNRGSSISIKRNRDNLNNFMNKAELAQTIAGKIGASKKDAEEMVASFVEIVTSTLKSGGEVNIAGFGAFSARTRAGRIGVNPQNPSEKIQIPSVVVPKFKAGKGLKDALKKHNV